MEMTKSKGAMTFQVVIGIHEIWAAGMPEAATVEDPLGENVGGMVSGAWKVANVLISAFTHQSVKCSLTAIHLDKVQSHKYSRSPISNRLFDCKKLLIAVSGVLCWSLNIVR